LGAETLLSAPIYEGIVTSNIVQFAAMIVLAVFVDGLVRPRCFKFGLLPCRSLAGFWLLCVEATVTFGIFWAICGNLSFSAVLTLALLALFAVASNAKYATLGEPLLFTDLALVGALFRHPQFYFSAISLWQRVLVALVAMALLALLIWQLELDILAHAWGLIVALGAGVVLMLTLRSSAYRGLAVLPDPESDTARHGLLPTMLLHWLRWRKTADPPPPANNRRRHHAIGGHDTLELVPELIVVIQCESFADPAELFAASQLELPALNHARANAWKWGALQVSGFGAYTMRTEYGVLFGREEEDLGFRRFDPFLTALGEASHALPAKLQQAGWRSLFVHPHDMRFYNRDVIMPAAGFVELVGEEQFSPPPLGGGRYVHDVEVAARVATLARASTSPSLLYAVTMENHGPWAAGAKVKPDEIPQEYVRLAGRSDQMLAVLMEEIAAMKRAAMLTFFGDHRPSIPGASVPGGARHTPYVVIRFDADGQIVGGGTSPVDLTPAQLHHVMLDAVLGAPSQ